MESLALGAEVRGKDVLPLLSGDLRSEMVEALRRVRTRFKTGCITNNLPANTVGSLGGRSLYIREVMALFDRVIESAKIGLRKPDHPPTGSCRTRLTPQRRPAPSPPSGSKLALT
jgi:putative hydrolase of the HAD superfamily